MGSHSVASAYLPPNTSLPSPQPSRLVLDLPTPEGRKAELSWVAWLSTKMVYPQTDTNLSTNPARRRLTLLMRPTILLQSQTATINTTDTHHLYGTYKQSPADKDTR